MKKAVLCVFCFMLVSTSAFAMKMRRENGAIIVQSATTAEVKNLFYENKYEDFTQNEMQIPRIYLTKLPVDWGDVAENDDKKRTFIRILLPIALQNNENILKERAQIENWAEKFKLQNNLPHEEVEKLEKLAVKYDVFTRMQGKERLQILLRQLLIKVDVVPPSILVATAAVYSDWGKSRLAMQANSLYLDEVWYTKEGLPPADDKDAEYRYKIYASLQECMAARALKINSHINYEYLREARRINRQMSHAAYGPQMVTQLYQDNNLKNIAGLIDYTITYFKLLKIDNFPSLRDAETMEAE